LAASREGAATRRPCGNGLLTHARRTRPKPEGLTPIW
jgi:hypothetical protein